jgi:hypothetical protein
MSDEKIQYDCRPTKEEFYSWCEHPIEEQEIIKSRLLCSEYGYEDLIQCKQCGYDRWG